MNAGPKSGKIHGIKPMDNSEFRYDYVKDYRLQSQRPESARSRIELHPGIHCDIFHCPFCFAKDHALSRDNLPLRDYEALFDGLRSRLSFVELSGVATDPLTYPEIEGLLSAILRRGLSFGIHTKGLRLVPQLALQATKGDSGSFITLSLHAPDPITFNKVHQLQDSNPAFSTIVENLRFLHEAREKTASKLRINLSYLLFKTNSEPEKLESFVRTFEGLCDCIRFAIPQETHRQKRPSHLEEEEIDQVVSAARKLESDQVIVLGYERSDRKRGFSACQAKHFSMTVDKSGKVFPCPHVALPRFESLSFGTLQTHSVTEILDSDRKKSVAGMPLEQMNCAVCSRRDESINCFAAKPDQ